MAMTQTGATSRQDRLVQQPDLTFSQMKLMVDQATREGRGFTEDENKRYTALTEQHAQFEKAIAQAASDDEFTAELDRITGGAGTTGRRSAPSGGIVRGHAQSP